MEKTEKLFLTVAEFAEVIGCSNYLAYEAVRQKNIRFVRFGRRIYIPKNEADRLSNIGLGQENIEGSDDLDCV